MECWCVCSGLCPVNREDPRIMRHNAAWDRASCRINPKLYPKPSEHSPGGHKVKSTTPDPRESGSGGEAGDWTWLLLLLLMMVKEVPGPWLLSVSAACCPQLCSSRLDFSQHSIYYLADLLKVISEPSGPARWPGKGGLLSGQTDWKIQMDTVELLKHTGSKQTENTVCIIKRCIHYRRNKSSSIFHCPNLKYRWMFN